MEAAEGDKVVADVRTDLDGAVLNDDDNAGGDGEGDRVTVHRTPRPARPGLGRPMSSGFSASSSCRRRSASRPKMCPSGTRTRGIPAGTGGRSFLKFFGGSRPNGVRMLRPSAYQGRRSGGPRNSNSRQFDRSPNTLGKQRAMRIDDRKAQGPGRGGRRTRGAGRVRDGRLPR